MRDDKSRIEVLDSFRALAIISVLAFHVFFLGTTTLGLVPVKLPGQLESIFSRGWLGVEFFFMISGFVIFMTIEKCATPFEFAIRRIARIWPAYLASTILIFFGVRLLGQQQFMKDWYDLAIAPLLWAPAFGGNYISGVYWSLVVECRFYLLMALVYFSFGRHHFKSAWLALTLASLAAPFVSEKIAIHIFSSAYLPLFSLGVVFYNVWRRDMSWHDVLIAAVSLISIWVLWRNADINPKGGQDVVAILFVLAAAFALFAVGKLQFLAVRPLLFIGRISYSLYLIHHELTLSIIAKLHPFCGPVPAVTIALCVTILLAAMMTLWIEDPGKRMVISAARAWRSTAQAPI